MHLFWAAFCVWIAIFLLDIKRRCSGFVFSQEMPRFIWPNSPLIAELMTVLYTITRLYIWPFEWMPSRAIQCCKGRVMLDVCCCCCSGNRIPASRHCRLLAQSWGLMTFTQRHTACLCHLYSALVMAYFTQCVAANSELSASLRRLALWNKFCSGVILLAMCAGLLQFCLWLRLVFSVTGNVYLLKLSLILWYIRFLI